MIEFLLENKGIYVREVFMGKKTKSSSKKEQPRKKNGQYDTLPIIPIAPLPAINLKPRMSEANVAKPCRADNPARRAWEVYLQNQENNTRSYMGYTYRIISSTNQIAHIEIWNADSDTWMEFSLPIPPNASEERQHDHIKETISSLMAHPSAVRY